MEAHGHADLFGSRAHLIYTFFVPFLVSRIIYTGAGKIGGENGAPEVPFQISQRADFFETVVGAAGVSATGRTMRRGDTGARLPGEHQEKKDPQQGKEDHIAYPRGQMWH